VFSDCVSNRASQNTGTFSVTNNFSALNLESLAGQPDGERRLKDWVGLETGTAHVMFAL